MKIIDKIRQYVRKMFLNEPTGHDWHHIERVWKMAIMIAQKEKEADMFVVEAAALLHDIADWKLNKGSIFKTRELLADFKVNARQAAHICQITKDISFKGAGVLDKINTIEGQIVQDADRLDALGAIGIARVFAYGGFQGRPIYDPKVKPRRHQSFSSYKTRSTTTINHFYEKLLLLKGRLHTETAKKIAVSRHKFMEEFLKRFLDEWQEGYNRHKT